MEDRSKRSTSVGVIANLRRRDSYSPEHGSWNPLSFAKSLRRRHKDFFPLDVSTSVLDGGLIRRPAKMLAENVNRALSGFQEREFGLQNYCS